MAKRARAVKNHLNLTLNPDFYKQYFQIEKDHWLMRVRRFIIFDLLKKYAKPPSEKVRILDFGCGSGYLVARLAERGFQSFGLDISAEAIEFGRRQGIKNIEAVDSHTINYPDNFFDAILLMDVIEHLEDESWAVKEVERVLAPGGVIIITVPAFMFLWGVQDEVAQHYRRYTLAKLLETVKRSSSLSVIRKTYFNTFLFMPIALVRVFSRWLNIKNRESDFDINNVFINKILFWIFNFERFLLQRIRFPFGVSILMVLKKQ